jgi:hypothetical protein
MVEDMTSVFQDATSFDQELCWDLQQVKVQPSPFVQDMFLSSNGCLIGSCVNHDDILAELTICGDSVAPTAPSTAPSALSAAAPSTAPSARSSTVRYNTASPFLILSIAVWLLVAQA